VSRLTLLGKGRKISTQAAPSSVSPQPTRAVPQQRSATHKMALQVLPSPMMTPPIADPKLIFHKKPASKILAYTPYLRLCFLLVVRGSLIITLQIQGWMEETKKGASKKGNCNLQIPPRKKYPGHPTSRCSCFLRKKPDHRVIVGSQEHKQAAQVEPLHIVVEGNSPPWGQLPVLIVATPTDGAQVEPLLISPIRPICVKRQMAR